MLKNCIKCYLCGFLMWKVIYTCTDARKSDAENIIIFG